MSRTFFGFPCETETEGMLGDGPFRSAPDSSRSWHSWRGEAGKLVLEVDQFIDQWAMVLIHPLGGRLSFQVLAVGRGASPLEAEQELSRTLVVFLKAEGVVYDYDFPPRDIAVRMGTLMALCLAAYAQRARRAGFPRDISPARLAYAELKRDRRRGCAATQSSVVTARSKAVH